MPSTGKVKNERKMGEMLLEHSRQFCDKTTIHGLRYVSERGASWIQTILWTVFIMLEVAFCCILMTLIWNRFQTNPTITAVETVNYPVWNVAFPSVTICDVNKVHKPRIDKIKNILLSNGFVESRIMLFFSNLSTLVSQNDGTEDTFEDVLKVLESKNYTIETIMLELMQPCSEMLRSCNWMGEEEDCVEMFRTIKTDDGFCCSFNYFQSNETFHPSDALNKRSEKFKSKVLSLASAGVHSGLSVVIDVKEENYISVTRIVPSVLVHIHDHLDFPEMKILGVLLQKGELVQIPVEPSVIDTTDDVKSLHHSKRNCSFEDEVHITIGAYGYENCIIECRMDVIVNKCGCIPFIYNIKHYKLRKNLRFCRFSDINCLENNNKLLYTLQSSDSTNKSSFGLQCSCFPTCDVTWYTYSSDVGEMIDREGENNSQIIALHVYYSEFSCIKYKQSNLITWDGLFASFGGIFGLCLGGSILSIVEFFYHFTIRLYAVMKNKGSQDGSTQKMEEKSKWQNTVPHFNNSKDNETQNALNMRRNKLNLKKFDVRTHRVNNEDVFFITKFNKNVY